MSPFKFVHLGLQWLKLATFDWLVSESILLHAEVMSKELSDTGNLEARRPVQKWTHLTTSVSKLPSPGRVLVYLWALQTK